MLARVGCILRTYRLQHSDTFFRANFRDRQWWHGRLIRSLLMEHVPGTRCVFKSHLSETDEAYRCNEQIGKFKSFGVLPMINFIIVIDPIPWVDRRATGGWLPKTQMVGKNAKYRAYAGTNFPIDRWSLAWPYINLANILLDLTNIYFEEPS